MGHAIDALGHITESHHARQQASMRSAGERFAQQREDDSAAYLLLDRWMYEARHGRQFADLCEQTEALLVRRYNNASNGQGVTP